MLSASIPQRNGSTGSGAAGSSSSGDIVAVSFDVSALRLQPSAELPQRESEEEHDCGADEESGHAIDYRTETSSVKPDATAVTVRSSDTDVWIRTNGGRLLQGGGMVELAGRAVHRVGRLLLTPFFVVGRILTDIARRLTGHGGEGAQ
jgi:hypothetical protein